MAVFSFITAQPAKSRKPHTVLRETKARSAAEFLQLGQSATWETLDSSFNGEQYDNLEALFQVLPE